jgi:hypothetical protein
MGLEKQRGARKLAGLKHCQLRWLSSPFGSKVLDFSLHGTRLAQSMRFAPFFVAMTKKVREGIQEDKY